jgi:hypothetical protein
MSMDDYNLEVFGIPPPVKNDDLENLSNIKPTRQKSKTELSPKKGKAKKKKSKE